MRRVPLAMIATALAAGPALAAGGNARARARAARDLDCPAGRLKLQVWEGGAKIEARGCGRNATYEDGELSMVEREPMPAMRARVVAELECPAGELTIRHTVYPQLGDDFVNAEGCGREVQLRVKDGVLTLVTLTRPASPDLARKVAADLGCAEDAVKVRVVKDASGETAGANDCHDGRFYRFRIQPFQRITELPSRGTLALVKQAAKDLGCDPNKVAIVTVPGSKDPTIAVDGCGRRATYARKGDGYVLASGPVQLQAPHFVPEGDVDEVARVQGLKKRAARDLDCGETVTVNLTKNPLKARTGPDDDLKSMEAEGCGRHARYQRLATGLQLTYVEKTVPGAWLPQVSHDLDCPVAQLEAHYFAFPQKPGPATLGVRGCDREASYQAGPRGPHLSYMLAKAPPDVVHKVAADLRCADKDVKVHLIRRDTTGPWAATATNCHGGGTWMYDLHPFRRIGKQ